jgi:hypothetical protein
MTYVNKMDFMFFTSTSLETCMHCLLKIRYDWLLFSIGFSSLYESLILPVVLYGCESLSLTLREDYRLRVFEKGWLENIWTIEG